MTDIVSRDTATKSNGAYVEIHGGRGGGGRDKELYRQWTDTT
jgi:hypothetical protein